MIAPSAKDHQFRVGRQLWEPESMISVNAKRVYGKEPTPEPNTRKLGHCASAVFNPKNDLTIRNPAAWFNMPLFKVELQSWPAAFSEHVGDLEILHWIGACTYAQVKPPVFS
jgi:hypothetical protein